MIEVINLHKSFDDLQVLKGISTTFEKGETRMIIGASGSGKTVLLKCLLGLIIQDEGEVSFDGRPYTKMSTQDKRELRKEMGMVFQSGALFDSETMATFNQFQVAPDKEYLAKLEENNKKFSRVYPTYDQDIKFDVRGYTFPFYFYCATELKEVIFLDGLGGWSGYFFS